MLGADLIENVIKQMESFGEIQLFTNDFVLRHINHAATMHHLIIHPQDPSTDFLKEIYQHLPDHRVIDKKISSKSLTAAINKAERIIFLGHGCSIGLLDFYSSKKIQFMINHKQVPLIKDKNECLFIWCHADEFVWYHKLSGFCTGMFISELQEAVRYGFKDATQAEIDLSNKEFVKIVANHLHLPTKELLTAVKLNYAQLAAQNTIAQFNLDRLYAF